MQVCRLPLRTQLFTEFPFYKSTFIVFFLPRIKKNVDEKAIITKIDLTLFNHVAVIKFPSEQQNPPTTLTCLLYGWNILCGSCPTTFQQLDSSIHKHQRPLTVMLLSGNFIIIIIRLKCFNFHREGFLFLGAVHQQILSAVSL